MRPVLGAVAPGCRQRLTAHYGRAIIGWLRDAPEMIEAAARSWELRLVGYHDAGHASVLAVAQTGDGEPVVVKAWYDRDRYRNEIAALRHWEPVNGRIVRVKDDEHAVACLALIGLAPGGGPRPEDGDQRVVEGLARLHALPPPDVGFPSLKGYLSSTVGPRISRRLRRYGSGLPYSCVGWGLHAEPAPTWGGPVLLHADLYRENVPFTDAGRPVFLDPLPMLGDPAFDWAFFIVYFDIACDPITRLRLATLVSRIDVGTLVPWCMRLCLDGLLYYREIDDAREPRMIEVMSALAAEGGTR
jgi:streptomycin 6-kinase